MEYSKRLMDIADRGSTESHGRRFRRFRYDRHRRSVFISKSPGMPYLGKGLPLPAQNHMGETAKAKPPEGCASDREIQCKVSFKTALAMVIAFGIALSLNRGKPLLAGIMMITADGPMSFRPGDVCHRIPIGATFHLSVPVFQTCSDW